MDENELKELYINSFARERVKEMYNVKESDWKIFRKKIIGWQESHMKKLNEEYIKILQRDENPAKNFWNLEKRIWNDEKECRCCY